LYLIIDSFHSSKHAGKHHCDGLSTAAFFYITPWSYPVRSYMPSFLFHISNRNDSLYFSIFHAAFNFRNDCSGTRS